MNNYVGVVFDNDAKACDGLHALWELDRRGEVTVHGAAVIHRTGLGDIEVAMKHTQPGQRTVVGIAIGALLGALAAPVGAVAGLTIPVTTAADIGAVGGSIIGLTADATKADEHHEAGRGLGLVIARGQAAVIAEVSEDWTASIDTTMAQLGGKVFRRALGEVRNALFHPEDYAAPLYPYDYEPRFTSRSNDDGHTETAVAERNDATPKAAGRAAGSETNDYVAIVFDSEPQAAGGLHALWDLDRRHELTVHGATVIRRNDRGRIDVVMQQRNDQGLRTAAGVALGTLLGALADPVGAAIHIGGATSDIAEALKSGERGQAVREVGLSLKDGQFAVIAEVTEDRNRPLGSVMSPLGGTVYRRPTSSVRDDMHRNFQYPDALVPYEYQPHFEKQIEEA
jgi:uncharacterized membrane protein